MIHSTARLGQKEPKGPHSPRTILLKLTRNIASELETKFPPVRGEEICPSPGVLQAATLHQQLFRLVKSLSWVQVVRVKALPGGVLRSRRGSVKVARWVVVLMVVEGVIV